MKIIEELNSEEVTNSEKLIAIEAFVSTVREAYGNGEKTITEVKVSTTNGWVPIAFLSLNERVELAKAELTGTVANALAITENTEGSIFDRAVEALVSVNPILTNITAKSDSQY